MINLLPPDVKDGYLYARKNVGLRKWLVLFVLAFVGLGVIATYGMASLRASQQDYSRSIAATETVFEQEEFSGTQERVQNLSSSFKLAVSVLSQEVLFSQLLKQIGTAIPDNANLTGLTISQVQGAIDISAVATDYQTATQVQVNLEDPRNKIFSKADIISISCAENDAEGAASEYPCTVNIRALFAPDNPFLFINSKGTKQ